MVSTKGPPGLGCRPQSYSIPFVVPGGVVLCSKKACVVLVGRRRDVCFVVLFVISNLNHGGGDDCNNKPYG